ncbi:MAG: hypothetical protein ABI354_02500 [Candidatus Saccharimonadales bacterium]
MLPEVKIDKLIHGGQGLGVLPDGRKVLAWNVLPGEVVQIRSTKSKKHYVEGVAENIIQASPERIDPIDDAYLSTSPWQIMSFEAENKYKQEILSEVFEREKIDYKAPIEFIAIKDSLHYRNKMEYSFWADDTGLHLALFNRGTHGKRVVEGSSIAHPAVDETASKIVEVLKAAGIRGSQLKTVIVRCNQAGEAVAALFVKDEDFPVLNGLAEVCKGIGVYYSTPKSPASVITSKLYIAGDLTLTDKIIDAKLIYDVHSFFQVNLPVFELVAERIKGLCDKSDTIVDFYSGVGAIGVSVGASILVDSDKHNVAMAKRNVGNTKIEVVRATAETALDCIPSEGTLIVDPPRAGLHSKVIDQICESSPDQVIYLSCNPSTQARDLDLLKDCYDVVLLEGYNFFPRTPHIECLAVLKRK